MDELVYLIYGPFHGEYRNTEAPALDISEYMPITSLNGPNKNIVVGGFLVHRYEKIHDIFDPRDSTKVISCFIYKGCRSNPMPNNQAFLIRENDD